MGVLLASVKEQTSGIVPLKLISRLCAKVRVAKVAKPVTARADANKILEIFFIVFSFRNFMKIGILNVKIKFTKLYKLFLINMYIFIMMIILD